MGKYTIRRVLLIFPTLFIASLLLALLLRLLPGDVIRAVTGAFQGSDLQDEAGLYIARVQLGLDKPFPIQYISWVLGWRKGQGAVFQTADGGQTWRRTSINSFLPVTHLAFVEPSRGWALRGKMVFGTLDGGIQWLNQYGAPQTLNNLFALDAQHAWVVGNRGVIARTTEGGLRLGGAGGSTVSTWLPLNSGVDQDLYDVSFVDADSGWAVGAKGTLLHTADGGVTWQPQATNTNVALRAVAFADTARGWAVGDRGVILATSDGGAAWTLRASGTQQGLRDVASAAGGVVWAVGNGGTVLKSADGGATWAPEAVGQEQGGALRAVAFGDDRNGVLVGDGGLVLVTADAGATWTRSTVLARPAGGSADLEEMAPVTMPLADATVQVSGLGTVRAWVAATEWRWRWGVVGGDLGNRFLFGGRPVAQDIVRALGPSVQLMLMALTLSITVSIPVGILSAIRQDTVQDYVGRTVAIIGVAVPSFWLAMIVIIIPAFYLGWVPPLLYVGFFDNASQNLYYYMLPTLVVGFGSMAALMRMTRSMMLEVMRQDYMRTAYSKGLTERMVILRHALKNAMIPVITLVGLQVPWLLGSLVVIEQVFTIPGLGRLMLESLYQRDLPMIQGLALFLGCVVAASNLLVDLAYGWLDPRIRYA